MFIPKVAFLLIHSRDAATITAGGGPEPRRLSGEGLERMQKPGIQGSENGDHETCG